MKEDLTDEEFEEWMRNAEEELRLMTDKVKDQIKELTQLLMQLRGFL
jgi:hypothetical protein